MNEHIKQQEDLAMAEQAQRNFRAYVLDRRIERLQLAKERLVREENRAVAHERREAMRKLDEELAQNEVSAEFFDQFQKDAR